MHTSPITQLLYLLFCAVALAGCDRADSQSAEQSAVQLFEQTVGAYTANALETDARYDVKKTDSLVTPYQVVYYATFVAGNGTRLQRRKVFNFRDGEWYVASVEHQEDSEWVPGAWRGGSDEDLSMEKFYWDEAVKKRK